MEEILKIAAFIADSFIQLWPYLLITIPLAVAIKFTGASGFINKALNKKPLVSILLATAVGALSPFCSCGVIPVIASLLIGGVPLAPVMSFWIASPSMDPEIFFLSTATIGWELSIWRLAATFIISLSAGYITHFAVSKGYLGTEILRQGNNPGLKNLWKGAWKKLVKIPELFPAIIRPSKKVSVQLIPVTAAANQASETCCINPEELRLQPEPKNTGTGKSCGCDSSCRVTKPSFRKQLAVETWKATTMVAKFMTLAFLVNALIKFYVPADFITNLIGGDGSFAVVIASLTGIPVYTSNLTALPLISGLLALGMNKGAALAFLISGPTTTLPAMAAVWGIVNRKIFFLYVSFSLFGAIIFGVLFNLFS